MVMRKGAITVLAVIAVLAVVAVNVGYAYSGNTENNGNSLTNEYAQVYLYSDMSGAFPLTSAMTKNLTFNSVTKYEAPNHVTTYVANSTLLADCYVKIAGSHVRSTYTVQLTMTKPLSSDFTYTATLGSSAGTPTLVDGECSEITFTGVPASEAGTISHLQVYAEWKHSGQSGYAPPADITPIKFVVSAIHNDSSELHRVVFEPNGGTDVQMQFITDGGTATEPTDPTRTGYTFGGWYTDVPLTVAYSFSTTVSSDLTLYAKWTEA